jgi:hypothetical protein
MGFVGLQIVYLIEVKDRKQKIFLKTTLLI